MMFEYYKERFSEGNASILWGGDFIDRQWDDTTLYLYIGIVLVTVFLSKILDKKLYNTALLCNSSNCSIKNVFEPNKTIFYFLFILFAIVLAGRDYTVGIDTIQYLNNITYVDELGGDIFSFQFEPLFRGVLYVLHYVLPNYKWGIFILSFATLCLLFLGIKRYFGNISIYISFLTFVCLYFFPAMNLMRITLAASIILYNSHFLIEGKIKSFALTICVCFLIHFSSIVMFLPLGVYLLYRKSKTISFALLIVLMALIVTSSFLFKDYITMIERYSGYMEDDSSAGNVGIMLFIDYLPCLYLSFYLWKKRINTVWSNLMVCYTASAFLVRSMAYFISVAGRLHVHFMFLTLILLPYWVNYLRKNSHNQYIFVFILCTIWALFRLHVYFAGFLASDGIMPYVFGLSLFN